MSNSCQTERRLCPIYVGDSIPFTFTFVDTDGKPRAIAGVKIYFTMKLDRNFADGKKGDLQHEVTFGADPDPVTGIGEILVPSSKTKELIPEKEYFYDFKVIDAGEPYTFGSGMVYVKINTTKALA